MKKIMVPLKEENTFIKELNHEEIETIEAGGWFTCFFWKRCVGFKSLAQYALITKKPVSHYA